MVSEDPEAAGVYLEAEVFPHQEDVLVDEREAGGYHFRKFNSPVEVKYRFPDELRSYPETVHCHNVEELYCPTGQFEMQVLTQENGDRFKEFSFGENMVVPAGVYHGIVSRDEQAGLAIIRGDPDNNTQIGKWDLDGNQQYQTERSIEQPETNYADDLIEQIED